MPDEMLISFGGELKALDNGHFGGYLVRFTDASNPDLAGDYFTKDTDFGMKDGQTSPVYFHHRQPLETEHGKALIIKAKIGEATLSIDDEGVLVDAIIYNREKYEKAITKAGRARKSDGTPYLGWSSGTAPHLCDREKKGGANFIKFWQLGMDASLTPTPCEPVNDVVPLKSLTDVKFERLEGIEAIRLDVPAAKMVDGERLFTDSLRQTEQQTWELWSAVQTGTRKIVEAALAKDVTGVEVNVREAVTALVGAYSPKLIEAIVAQVSDYLNSEVRDEHFYLKSVFDELTSEDSGARAASKFADHLEVVLAAAREVNQRAQEINGMRVKAGRVISAANRTRLSSLYEMCRSVAEEIDALLKEAEPKEAKSATHSFAALRMQTLRLESQVAGVSLRG